jgi:hypothetical protein
MKLRLGSHLLSFFLTVVLLAVASDVSAKSWYFSGDTNLCTKCPTDANVLPVRGNPLLSVDHTKQPFVGTIGGGLSISETSRFDFMPRITLDDDFVGNSFAATKATGDLTISANRTNDTMRFTDGRLPNGLISLPEPATVLLLGTGLSGLAAAVWKRRRATRKSM